MCLNSTKAILLAAGLGTRLRPLTSTTPKALILVNKLPLITYSLRLLQKYGIREVLINLHHLGKLIEKQLGNGSKFNMKITYSWEPEILGTGGGIKKAAAIFGHEPFLILNSDVLIDLNLKKLLEFHRRKKGMATMVVRPGEPDSSYTPILMSRLGRIKSIGSNQPQRGGEGEAPAASPMEGATRAPMIEGEKKHLAVTYTGVQVIEAELLKYLPDNYFSCIINDGYRPALAEGKKIFGFMYEGYWNDLGTQESYRQAENDLSQEKIKLSYI